MVDKLYHRANPRSSLRPIVCLVVEIQRFVCDRATPPIIEKLRSKGVAMHAYRIAGNFRGRKLSRIRRKGAFRGENFRGMLKLIA